MGSEQHHMILAAEVVRESVIINFTAAEKHDPAVVGVGLNLLVSASVTPSNWDWAAPSILAIWQFRVSKD